MGVSMMIGPWFNGAVASSGTDSLQAVGWSTFGILGVGLLNYFVRAVWLRFMLQPLDSHFICHHKVVAAAQSRVIQLLI